jgi:hypothetical protein
MTKKYGPTRSFKMRLTAVHQSGFSDILSLDYEDSDTESNGAAGDTTSEASAARRVSRKDVRRSKFKRRSIELRHCGHVFCGVSLFNPTMCYVFGSHPESCLTTLSPSYVRQACLAQSIYQKLNVPFDPQKYGTMLAPTPTAPLGTILDFPMGCPVSRV